ncbi:helix-turn-helix domain-containing protein [Kitasatospora sp. NPDC001664]
MDFALFDQAVAVMVRFGTAQAAYGWAEVDGVKQEVGLAELEAAWTAKDAFWAAYAASGQVLDRDLVDAVVQEQLTGRRNELIDRDEQGRPVAVRRITTLTAEQIARAQELLADPFQTITAVARELKVSRATLYSDVPGITGRPLAPRRRSASQSS